MPQIGYQAFCAWVGELRHVWTVALRLQEVADKVQAITSELCTQLDSLIEASPKEKGRK